MFTKIAANHGGVASATTTKGRVKPTEDASRAADRRDNGPALLSDDATLELVIRSQKGDSAAVEALLQRCLPSLRRWAHGRLPALARGHLETNDLVQEVILHLLRRLDVFQPQHVGALQAYLRQSVLNRIRDEVRRVSRQPLREELPEDCLSDRVSPLEAAIRQETYERYRQRLARLKSHDRQLIVARIEAQWSLAAIAHHFQFRTVDAARMAVNRASQRLIRNVQPDSSPNRGNARSARRSL